MAKKIKRKKWFARVFEIRRFDYTSVVWASSREEAEAKMLMGDTEGECLGRSIGVIGRTIDPYDKPHTLGEMGR